jgi:gag-polypeptide of LTR copia-type
MLFIEETDNVFINDHSQVPPNEGEEPEHEEASSRVLYVDAPNEEDDDDDDIIKEITAQKYRSLSALSEKLHLNENNWADWSQRITPILCATSLWEYINGSIKKPNRLLHHESNNNWISNDKLAKVILIQNVAAPQLCHIDQDQTFAKVWIALKTLHQTTRFHTTLTYMRNLFCMKAEEDENIPEYINKMKTLVEEINTM